MILRKPYGFLIRHFKFIHLLLCTLSFYEILGGTFGDIENSNFYYQRDHPEGKYYEGEPKYWNHLGRLVPYYKSIYNLNHPYEALESYEFGRKLGGR